MMSEYNGPAGTQPVVVRGRLVEPLSRWLWLVKWLLLIPHYIVLAFLWLAFVLVTVVAFFAILFTGRYPRSLFAFNLGVLRWSWRVSYYGYSALATDRYPPFSLGEEPTYPATLDIAYPQRLSRGLALVKWWLLAIPHYLILSFILGGATYTVTTATGDTTTWKTAGGGLLPLLVLFAGVALLFAARYPRGLHDLVTGFNRWVYRVIAYAALMTDAYPPFRLDQGGDDPVAPRGPLPSAPQGAAALEPSAAGSSAAAPSAGAQERPSSGARGGAVVALVAGLITVLLGVGLAAAGGGGLLLQSRRDAAGFITTDPQLLSSPTAAVLAEGIDLRLDAGTPQWVRPNRFGTLRLRATGQGGSPVFIGVAPQGAVDRWLAGTTHDEVNSLVGGEVTYLHRSGQAQPVSPVQETFWSSSASGTGTQELRWPVQTGQWAIVVARPDGAAGVRATVDLGATVPGLQGLALGLLAIGVVLVGAGAVLVIVGAVGLGRRTGEPSMVGRPAMTAPLPPSPRTAVEDEVTTTTSSPPGMDRGSGI
jgi:Domain of unknown function (DUF4389)